MPLLQTETSQPSVSSEESTPNPFGWGKLDRIGFFSAHPDDLEMMMGHAAVLAVALGAQPHVYIATQGEASTRGDEDFVRHGGRINEALAGAKSLGVDSGNICVSNLPDGELANGGDYEVLADDIERFISSRELNHAVTLGQNGGDGRENWEHTDHVAVHNAVLQTAGNVPVWGLNSQHDGEFLVMANAKMIDRKLGALALHSSQWWLQKFNGSVPESWQRVGGFVVPPASFQILEPYKPFLLAETYDKEN